MGAIVPSRRLFGELRVDDAAVEFVLDLDLTKLACLLACLIARGKVANDGITDVFSLLAAGATGIDASVVSCDVDVGGSGGVEGGTIVDSSWIDSRLGLGKTSNDSSGFFVVFGVPIVVSAVFGADRASTSFARSTKTDSPSIFATRHRYSPSTTNSFNVRGQRAV